MASHSSTLAWRIPWREEPGRLLVHGVAKSWTRLSDFAFTTISQYKPKCDNFFYTLIPRVLLSIVWNATKRTTYRFENHFSLQNSRISQLQLCLSEKCFCPHLILSETLQRENFYLYRQFSKERREAQSEDTEIT